MVTNCVSHLRRADGDFNRKNGGLRSAGAERG